MKTLLTRVSTLALAWAALGLAALSAAEPRIVIDFTKNGFDPIEQRKTRAYEYSYNDWENDHVVGLDRRGVLIKAPSGKGGLGQSTLDDYSKYSELDLLYVVGQGNKAKGLVFTATDNDGTEVQWNVPLEGKALGQPTVARFVLAKPDNVNKPGKKAGFDAKRVASWQVRGDFQTPKVEVLLIRLLGSE